MHLHSLVTHEIGSLAKPSWRVKAFLNSPLNEHDIEGAKYWGEFLGIESTEHLLKVLSKKEHFTQQEKAEILSFSSLYATRFLEKSGLDLIWDGEQHRVEMYEHVIKHAKGFVCRGHVRSFDNKYYEKASCIDLPSCKPLHLDELETIKNFTSHPIKIPITGAYTLVDWSFDEFYSKHTVPGMNNVAIERKKSRKQFLKDVAVQIVHPTLEALYQKGAHFLQIDEPAAATKREEIADFVEATKLSVGNLAGKLFFSMHLCFSDYPRLMPPIKELEQIIDAIHLECANRDTLELGVHKDKRKGYDILHSFKDTAFKIGIGVCDVHTDYIESPELIRDRILFACDILGDPHRVMVAPDCGLRTRTWEVAFKKLQNLVFGRNLAAIALGINANNLARQNLENTQFLQ